MDDIIKNISFFNIEGGVLDLKTLKNEIDKQATTSVVGRVQLSTATNSTSTTMAATPSAVKAAYDLANGKANASHGTHVPATQTANARVFLRNDNTWQTLPSASTSATGIVQLNDAVNSTSTTQAATANAVKKAYDLANGKANASHGTHVTYSTTTPKANGTATVGTESGLSRGDHVHPLQTTISGNAGTATKLQTPRTINGVSFDGTQNITIPIASHNHDSNYLKTNGDSGFCGNLLIDTSSTESKFKTTTGGGFFFNKTRLGMYDWTKDRDILAYKYETSELTLGSGTVSTKVNGTFYGMNNIALTRGSLWIQSLAGNATCDYLRFGTNIIASNDSKQAYLIDTAGNRANLDVGHLTANSIRLTNGGYPALQFSSNVRIEYDAASDALYAAGTKSSSSGFREFRATQCNSTVNAIIAGKRLFIQSGTPSGVSTGDVWIQV